MSEIQSVDETIRTTMREQGAGNLSTEDRIDRAPVRAFVLLSIVYFAAVLILSSMKLLWIDELITLHIAKLGGAVAIWNALAHGADPNPPVTHLLVHYSRALFGDHEWAYRLPAAVGYWIGMCSLFSYLRPRLGGTWAIAGTLLSMSMAAFDYSYESRSYGIFYGLAMLAFLCWTLAVDPARSTASRTLAVIGLALALAVGISTNYFAVLAFFPVAAGETMRTVVRARDARAVQGRLPLWGAIDLRIWVAMALAATSLLAYRGLIAHAISQFAPYAWNKVSIDQALDSYTGMVEIVLYPILALFVFAAGLWMGRRHNVTPVEQRPVTLTIPLHEAIGVLFLMAYPLIGYIVASVRGGMLSPRFVIPVCFGFAIAATFVAYAVFGRMRRAGLVFVCLMAAWFLCREAVVGYWYHEQKHSFYQLLDRVPAATSNVPADAPIAIPDPLLAPTFEHYAAPDIARRVVFPLDFPAIRAFRHDDSPEENLWAGRNLIYSMPIETIAEFQETAHDYLIIAPGGNWFLHDLARHHYLFNHLPIKSHATELGGFTPLAHGVPGFYTASWDNPSANIPTPSTKPIPFRAEEDVPAATPDATEGDSQ
jgi:hypothetical protein